VKLAHLNKSGVWPSGNPRLYFRPKGQKGLALPDLPVGDPNFLAAYAKAAGLSKPPRAEHRTGTLGAAIGAFSASDHYLSRAQSTRMQWRRILGKIGEKYGHVAFAPLNAQHIRADLAPLDPHPANNRLKVWRALCRWSLDAGLVKSDPTKNVAKKKAAQTDGHIAWSRDDIAMFREFWPIDKPERLALELLFWTGVRISDAVRLSVGMIDSSGWLEFKQQKTGGTVAVPFTAAAPAFSEPDSCLQDAIQANPQGSLLYIVTRYGSPRTVKGASQWFSAAARKAGISNKTADGLRKLRAMILAENGATTHQIGAWTGHESLTEVQLYARRANKRKIISGTESSNSSKPVPTIGRKQL